MSTSVATKFLIKNSTLFHNSLNPNKVKKFAIGKACVEAVKVMEASIGERDLNTKEIVQLDVSTSESSIRKNISKGFLTQQNLHSIICLLFHDFEKGDKYYQNYSNNSIELFLSSISLKHNEQGSVKVFRDFFKKLKVPERYADGYKIEIDENWNFNLVGELRESQVSHGEFEENRNSNKKSMKIVIWLIFLISLVLIFWYLSGLNFQDNKTIELEPVIGFDETMLGKGFTTIHNLSIDGRGKRVLGTKDKIFGEVGDTILVSIMAATWSKKYIKNVKIELDETTDNNTIHIFSGHLSGYDVGSVFDNAFLYTPERSKLRNINKSFYQKNNAKSEIYNLSDKENSDVFSGGYNLGDLFPKPENYIALTVQYVIEAYSKNHEYGFGQDPTGNLLGHTFIDFYGFYDELYLDIPEYNDSQEFNLILDYMNVTETELSNVTAKIDFEDSATKKIVALPIIGTLIGSDSIYSADATYLSNLPNKWELLLERIELINYPKINCDSITYQYKKRFDVRGSAPYSIELPNLSKSDSKDSIPCSSGYLKARFKITNKDFDTKKNENL